ncbi:hypothetical protein LPJ61_004115 [Coemansia biformis]|uniref:Uncharacterized protein n=1 Tax=Coemansia biformis TaxID=1286918 RepID=A0A9W7YBQ1_9FUNG|nr:hypothetical protein LPJ61_004115 [Coemansia biformis]
MSVFHYDFAKFNNAFDITNGADTLTIHSTKHVVESCVCGNCKSIMAQRAEEEKKKKEHWSFKYTYTPPAAPAPAPAPPPPSCCGCHHHHHHH